MSNRWAEYYRANQRVMLAQVACFRIDPNYDDNEPARQSHIESYQSMADQYGRMADESEE